MRKLLALSMGRRRNVHYSGKPRRSKSAIWPKCAMWPCNSRALALLRPHGMQLCVLVCVPGVVCGGCDGLRVGLLILVSVRDCVSHNGGGSALLARVEDCTLYSLCV